jgi:hypothetical protein
MDVDFGTLLLLFVIIIGLILLGVGVEAIITLIASVYGRKQIYDDNKKYNDDSSKLLAEFCEPNDKLSSLSKEIGIKYLHKKMLDAEPTRETSATCISTMMYLIKQRKPQPVKITKSARIVLAAFVLIKRILTESENPADHIYANRILHAYAYDLHTALAAATAGEQLEVDIGNPTVTNLKESRWQTGLYNILTHSS